MPPTSSKGKDERKMEGSKKIQRIGGVAGCRAKLSQGWREGASGEAREFPRDHLGGVEEKKVRKGNITERKWGEAKKEKAPKGCLGKMNGSSGGGK